jgi:Ca-activated chloride channel family protein
MTRTSFFPVLFAATCVVLGMGSLPAGAQPAPVATFRAGVDLVRVSAVVRDQKGRFVQDLSAPDFEVLESGLPRPITSFRRYLSGASVALLFDVSGSMEVSSKLAHAREAATLLLSWLGAEDEAAIFVFDTALQELTPFTTGLRACPPALEGITPFGATSLHDAIAQTATLTGNREGRRRAVVVLSDGSDNASRLSAAEVSGIASAIDVPVYIIGIVSSIDDPSADIAVTPPPDRSPLAGSLADLAAWTGGQVFVASTPMQWGIAARQIVDELRHQYLIAFESSDLPGWHPLVIRARGRDLVVRARGGYIAGDSRQTAN